MYCKVSWLQDHTELIMNTTSGNGVFFWPGGAYRYHLAVRNFGDITTVHRASKNGVRAFKGIGS